MFNGNFASSRVSTRLEYVSTTTVVVATVNECIAKRVTGLHSGGMRVAGHRKKICFVSCILFGHSDQRQGTEEPLFRVNLFCTRCHGTTALPFRRRDPWPTPFIIDNSPHTASQPTQTHKQRLAYTHTTTHIHPPTHTHTHKPLQTRERVYFIVTSIYMRFRYFNRSTWNSKSQSTRTYITNQKPFPIF